MKKKRLYIDMDNVICDFKDGVKRNILAPISSTEEQFPQSRIGFFILLNPIPKSIESVKLLNEHYDVWFLSRPSFYNLHCYTEKAVWIRKHFGYEFQKKLILCGDKSLVKGDYLIDDSITDGQLEFEGELIRFGSEEYPDWDLVIRKLIPVT